MRLLNEGYWGMNIVKGGNYFLRSIIRTSEDYHGTVSVKLLSEDGTVLASEILDITTDGQWNDVRETLTAVGQDTRARLALEFDAPGTIWVDYVSLFPEIRSTIVLMGCVGMWRICWWGLDLRSFVGREDV